MSPFTERVAELASYADSAHAMGPAGSVGPKSSVPDALLSPPFLVGMVMIMLLVVWATGEQKRAMRAGNSG